MNKLENLIKAKLHHLTFTHSYYNRIGLASLTSSIENRILNRFDKYILLKIQANCIEPDNILANRAIF